MIKKAFNTAKEITEFKKNYANGEIEIEVVMNLIQPFYKDQYPKCKEYFNFWYPENSSAPNLIGVLKMMTISFGSEALKDSFGKYDFKYKGNRMYENYVLEFDGLIFVVSPRAEVLIDNKINKEDLVEKLAAFENEFAQLVVNYISKNINNMDDYVKNNFNQFKKSGMIDSENKINFSYVNPLIKKSVKLPT